MRDIKDWANKCVLSQGFELVVIQTRDSQLVELFKGPSGKNLKDSSKNTDKDSTVLVIMPGSKKSPDLFIKLGSCLPYT